MECKQVGILTGGKWDKMHDCIRRVYDTDALSPTITSGGGGHHEVKIAVWDGFNQRIRKEQDTVGTITQNVGADLKRNGQGIIEQGSNVRIRKLTPKECWRLMGFTDEQFDRAKEAGTSDTQLYKQAGNSIVVDVLYHIFKELL